MNRVLLLFVLFGMTVTGACQVAPRVSSDESIICRYSDGPIALDTSAPAVSKSRAEEIVRHEIGLINQALGLNTTLVIESTLSTDPAESVTIGARRFLRINSRRLAQMDFERVSLETWAIRGAIAHEAAHHLLGHTEVGASKSSKEREADADEFSGALLYRMGAEIDEAQAAPERFADLQSDTHGTKEDRMRSVRRGYVEARRIDQDSRLRVRYSNLMQAASASTKRGHHDLARSFLLDARPRPGETDYRGTEWFHLWKLLFGDEKVYYFQPNTTQSGPLSFVQTFISPNGIDLLFSTNEYSQDVFEGHPVLWRASWPPSAATPHLFADRCTAAALSADGKWFAYETGGPLRRELRICDLKNAAPLELGKRETIPALSLVFSHDGTRLAVLRAKTVTVWSTPKGAKVAQFERTGDRGFTPGGIALSDDGQTLYYLEDRNDLPGIRVVALDQVGFPELSFLTPPAEWNSQLPRALTTLADSLVPRRSSVGPLGVRNAVFRAAAVTER